MDWASFQIAIKAQFQPTNVQSLSRKKLAGIKHTGNIRDYVIAFSEAVLQCEYMSEHDKLYNFIKGLQPWAANNLELHYPQTLVDAIKVADAMADYYSLENPQPSGTFSSSRMKGRGRGSEQFRQNLEEGEETSSGRGNGGARGRGWGNRGRGRPGNPIPYMGNVLIAGIQITTQRIARGGTNSMW